VSKPSSGTGSSDANKLHYVPLFYPILKSSIDLKEDQALFQLNSDAVCFCLLYLIFKIYFTRLIDILLFKKGNTTIAAFGKAH
jgi:hypothetical protein